MRQYIFYYYVKDDVIRGYIVMGMFYKTREGLILDYAESETGSLEKILRYVNTR